MYMYVFNACAIHTYVHVCVDGFRKVAKPEQHTLVKSVTAENLEFWHTNFRRGHPELLHLVQRKVCFGTIRTMCACACTCSGQFL